MPASKGPSWGPARYGSMSVARSSAVTAPLYARRAMAPTIFRADASTLSSPPGKNAEPTRPRTRVLRRAAGVVVEVRALQHHADLVLAVQRKVVTDGRAATRSERQVVVHPHVLHQHHVRHAVGLQAGLHRRIADGEAADLSRGRQVA